MDYSVYVRIATQFVCENYGGLDILKKQNLHIENELHSYMHKFVMAEYISDPKMGIKVNQEFKTRFINSLRN